VGKAQFLIFFVFG